MRISLLAFSMFCILISSCHNEKKPETKVTAETSDAIINELKILDDSLNFHWNTMISSDDQKIEDIKRLLLEISYCKRYNILAHDSLVKLSNNIKSIRYDMESMIESSKIDDYDDATDELIKKTIALTSSTPGIGEHDIVPKLLEDIDEADKKIYKFRVVYDEWAIKYNEYITKNENTLKTLGKPYSSLKKKPLFRITS